MVKIARAVRAVRATAEEAAQVVAVVREAPAVLAARVVTVVGAQILRSLTRPTLMEPSWLTQPAAAAARQEEVAIQACPDRTARVASPAKKPQL